MEWSPENQFSFVCDGKFQSIEDRLDEYRSILQDQGRAISKIEQKIFNGFDTKINMINEKVDETKESLQEAKKEWKSGLEDINKRLHGILVTLLFSIITFVIGILGTVLFKQ